MRRGGMLVLALISGCAAPPPVVPPAPSPTAPPAAVSDPYLIAASDGVLVMSADLKQADFRPLPRAILDDAARSPESRYGLHWFLEKDRSLVAVLLLKNSHYVARLWHGAWTYRFRGDLALWGLARKKDGRFTANSAGAPQPPGSKQEQILHWEGRLDGTDIEWRIISSEMVDREGSGSGMSSAVDDGRFPWVEVQQLKWGDATCTLRQNCREKRQFAIEGANEWVYFDTDQDCERMTFQRFWPGEAGIRDFEAIAAMITAHGHHLVHITDGGRAFRPLFKDKWGGRVIHMFVTPLRDVDRAARR